MNKHFLFGFSQVGRLLFPIAAAVWAFVPNWFAPIVVLAFVALWGWSICYYEWFTK